jgi:hypothetical protein
METVSQLLGHKKIEVTQRHYSKWILERQQNIGGRNAKFVVTYRSREENQLLERA